RALPRLGEIRERDLVGPDLRERAPVRTRRARAGARELLGDRRERRIIGGRSERMPAEVRPLPRPRAQLAAAAPLDLVLDDHREAERDAGRRRSDRAEDEARLARAAGPEDEVVGEI